MNPDMTKVAYNTLGCKVNQYETERIREALEAKGFPTVPFSSKADIYIVNTCSVTTVADSKSRAAIRRALKLNPSAYVIVAGCYAQLEPTKVGNIEGVDLVVPNDEKDLIPERIIARFGEQVETTRSVSPRPRTRTRAVVKVQDGCDQFCSYCVIPFARSKKTSRDVEDVAEELRNLASFGYREVVLAGIRLGSYQNDSTGLPELVQAAAQIEGIERIRLSSIEPWEVDDALLDVMQHPKVCRHLHIPLQSGDDEILKRMNRPYDSSFYLDVVSKVRERIPGVGITTDVIVGFPGEKLDAFGNTCRIIERVDFSRLHVFRYSPRERTKAAEMTDQVASEVKKERSERLMQLGRGAMVRFASSFIGETLNILIETRAPSSNQLVGFADNYIEVKVSGEPSLKGQIVPVVLTGVDQDGGATGVIG